MAQGEKKNEASRRSEKQAAKEMGVATETSQITSNLDAAADNADMRLHCA